MATIDLNAEVALRNDVGEMVVMTFSEMLLLLDVKTHLDEVWDYQDVTALEPSYIQAQ